MIFCRSFHKETIFLKKNENFNIPPCEVGRQDIVAPIADFFRPPNPTFISGVKTEELNSATIEFKLSFFTQISSSWWQEFKSEFKWSLGHLVII